MDSDNYIVNTAKECHTSSAIGEESKQKGPPETTLDVDKAK